MIFSGCKLGMPETKIICVAVVVINIAYFGRSILERVLDFILKLRAQTYNQSIPKSEANEQDRRMRQMELDHEFRMEKLKNESNNNNSTTDNINIPPADVTDGNYKYLS